MKSAESGGVKNDSQYSSFNDLAKDNLKISIETIQQQSRGKKN